jgi:hypothetical protein
LVTVGRAHPTRDDERNAPRDTVSSVSVNVGGNNIPGERTYKRNFTVDPASPQRLAYIALAQRGAGAPTQIMLKHPAESDEQVMAPIDGRRYGQLARHPLHLNTRLAK